MAVSGHNTMSEAARYTAAADQEHLACAAFERMGDLPCAPPAFMGHARLHTLLWGAPGTKIMLPADVLQPMPRYTNSALLDLFRKRLRGKSDGSATFSIWRSIH